LGDRCGWLWLRSESPEAILIRTRELSLPGSRELEQAVAPLLGGPAFGGRLSRIEFDQLVAERERRWKTEGKADVESSNVEEFFTKAYRSARGRGTGENV